jgi:hypothetical protein
VSAPSAGDCMSGTGFLPCSCSCRSSRSSRPKSNGEGLLAFYLWFFVHGCQLAPVRRRLGVNA